MIISSSEYARFLPVGDLAFENDGEFVIVSIDESYVCAAAQHLIDNGFHSEVSTQAELVANAVNRYKWGLGANNYTAVVGPETKSFSAA